MSAELQMFHGNNLVDVGLLDELFVLIPDQFIRQFFAESCCPSSLY